MSRARRFMRRRHDRKAARRKACELNLADWQTLSPQEQLQALDRRLGKDVGAKAQRARLMAKLAKPAAPAKVEAETAATDEPREAKPKLKAKERRAKEKKA